MLSNKRPFFGWLGVANPAAPPTNAEPGSEPNLPHQGAVVFKRNQKSDCILKGTVDPRAQWAELPRERQSSTLQPSRTERNEAQRWDRRDWFAVYTEPPLYEHSGDPA